MTDKFICGDRHCNWQGTYDDVLIALSPFNKDNMVMGCPQCQGINTLERACDHDNCWRPATCGTPSSKGYQVTCGKHIPKE